MRKYIPFIILLVCHLSCSDEKLELDNTEYYSDKHFIQFEDFTLSPDFVDLRSDGSLVISGTGTNEDYFDHNPFVLEVNKEGQLRHIDFLDLGFYEYWRTAKMAVTEDEKYIMATISGSRDENSDILVRKVDRRGEEDWSMDLGMASKHDIPNAIDRMDFGDVVILGSTGDEFNWMYDSYFLAVVSDRGRLRWKWPILHRHVERAIDVKYSTSERAVYVLTSNPESGSLNVPLMLYKLDDNGALIDSVRVFDEGDSRRGEFMKLTPDGQVRVHYTRSVRENSFDQVLEIKEFDNSLREIERFEDDEIPRNLIQDVIYRTDGSMLILSQSAEFKDGNFDVVLSKYDPKGSVLWRSVFGGSASDQGSAIKETTNGDIWIIGLSNQNTFSQNTFNMFLIRTDSLGVPLT